MAESTSRGNLTQRGFFRELHALWDFLSRLKLASLQLATYVKALRTGDRTLAVALRDSAGNKLSCDWTNDDDWQAIVGPGCRECADDFGG